MSRTVLVNINGKKVFDSDNIIKKIGKAYANKKTKSERPEGDFYSTPKSLVWVAENTIKNEFNNDFIILEPCSGQRAISQELIQYGFNLIENDLFILPGFKGIGILANDYLKSYFKQDYIITNPPFSLWDEFVLKAKTHCKKFMFIGRLNYFGTQSRLENNIWKNLKAVFPFSRYVDYQTPYRTDGLFHVGAMATAWFLWDMMYTGEPSIKILDVSEYAKLGNFKKENK